jgi:hypothetical protein
VPRGKYSNLSVRREVREELEKLRSETKVNDLNDLLILLVNTYREHTNTISKFEEVLTNAVSKAVKEALSSYTNTISMTTASHTNSVSTSPTSHTNTVSKSKPSSKITAWDILKRDKISCMSNIKARNPSRVIETLFENGAVKIDLGRDICVVEPEFWWKFWNTVEKFKTPNDEENLKEIKDEKMKWLYSELRREGILVLDSTRKPPAWTFDKRVEIPEKAFEISGTSQEEGEEEDVDEEYADYEDIYK